MNKGGEKGKFLDRLKAIVIAERGCIGLQEIMLGG